MPRLRHAAVFAALATILAVAAAPVSAASDTAPIGPKVFAKGSSVGVPAGNSMAITLECDIVGLGSVFSYVSITECSTSIGLSASPTTLPGNAAATANAGIFRLMPYQLCAAGYGVTLTGEVVTTDRACAGDTAGSAVVTASSP